MSTSIGSYCRTASFYEVVANMEVTNNSGQFMELSGYQMHRGCAENPPMNIRTGDKLLCGFHKTCWSAYGVQSTITWNLGSNTRIVVDFYVHYNSLINYEDNELKVEIVRNGTSKYQKLSGDNLCHVTNEDITVNGTIGNSNHSMIHLDIFQNLDGNQKDS